MKSTEPAMKLPGKNGGGGFTLMEVMVATLLISAMMISMLSFVQVAADNWRRTDQTLSLTSEFNTIDEYLSNISVVATRIASPTVAGGTIGRLNFDLPVATGTLGTANYFVASLTLKLAVAVSTKYFQSTKSADSGPAPAGPYTAGVAAADGAANIVNFNRYLASLSSHVTVSSFTRVASNHVMLFLRLETPAYLSDLATPTLEATLTYFFPNVF